MAGRMSRRAVLTNAQLRTSAAPFFFSCAVAWLIGSHALSVAAEQSATARVEVHWQSVPLGEAINRLEKLFGEHVFLDRRVNPEAMLSADFAAASLDEAVSVVAELQGLGSARIGESVYLGPRRAARVLPAITIARAEEISKLPRAQRLRDFLRPTS